MDNQAPELATVRSELTSVRVADAGAELSATRVARLGIAGEAGYSRRGQCYFQPGQHGLHHPTPGGHQQQPGQIGMGGKEDEKGCETGQRLWRGSGHHGLVGARPRARWVPPAARIFVIHPGVCLGQRDGRPPPSLLAVGGGHQPRHGLRMSGCGGRQLAPAGRSGRRDRREKSGGQSLVATELARLPSRTGGKWRRQGQGLRDGEHRAAQPNHCAAAPMPPSFMDYLANTYNWMCVGRAVRANSSSKQHHSQSCVKWPVFLKNVGIWSSRMYIFCTVVLGQLFLLFIGQKNKFQVTYNLTLIALSFAWLEKVTTDLRQRKHIIRQTSSFSVLLLQDVPAQQTRALYMRKKNHKITKR